MKRNFDRGSFAALLGVVLEPSDGKAFDLRGVSVGDCNLFRIRDHDLVTAWPSEGSGQFNSIPLLYGSMKESTLREHFQWITLKGLTAGDVLLLCSDELAKWALRMQENGTSVWSELGVITQSGLTRLAQDLRDERKMDADDIVLMQIRIV